MYELGREEYVSNVYQKRDRLHIEFDRFNCLITDLNNHCGNHQIDIAGTGTVSSRAHGEKQQAFSHYEISDDANRYAERLSNTSVRESGAVYYEDRPYLKKNKFR